MGKIRVSLALCVLVTLPVLPSCAAMKAQAEASKSAAAVLPYSVGMFLESLTALVSFGLLGYVPPLPETEEPSE